MSHTHQRRGWSRSVLPLTVALSLLGLLAVAISSALRRPRHLRGGWLRRSPLQRRAIAQSTD